MAHISTVKLLVAWARWGEGASIDYPSMSPMFGERALKTPLFGIGHIPDDVALVETAVCGLEWMHRDALIGRYHRHLTWSQLGERLGLSSHRARRRLMEAEDRIEQFLQKGWRSAKGSVISGQARKLSQNPTLRGVFAFKGS